MEQFVNPNVHTNPSPSIDLSSSTPNFDSFTFEFFGDTYFDQSGETLYITRQPGTSASSGQYGVNSTEAEALRDDFIDSLANQILRQEALGKVFHEDDVLFALNLGGGTISGDGFDADPSTLTSTNRFPGDGVSVSNVIDMDGNSISVVGGAKVDDVFKIARSANSGNATYCSRGHQEKRPAEW